MSTIIMSACWPIQGMSPSQKAVLISLADQANDDGVCWPSINTISVRTCLSERAVRDAIRWLESAGYLASKDRRGSSNVYQVTPEGNQPRQMAHPGGKCPPAANADHPGGKCLPPRQMPPVTPADAAPRTVKNHQLTVNEPVKRASTPQCPDDVNEQTWQDFLTLRKSKRAPVTETVMAAMQREADKAGVTLEIALQTCCETGWQGFNAGWYANRTAAQSGGQATAETAYQRSQRLRVAEACPDLARPAPDASEFFRTAKPMGHVVEVQAREVERIAR